MLQWIAFAEHPLELSELVEVCITDPKRTPHVQQGDREPMRAIVDVLSALVESVPGLTGTYVVLAHFPVKEYLTSNRIRTNLASGYSLDGAICAHDRAQCCLAYILHVKSNFTGILAKRMGPTCSSIEFEDLQAVVNKYPLFGKAVYYWVRWQRQAEVEIGERLEPGLELELLCRRENIDPNSNFQEVYRSILSSCLLESGSTPPITSNRRRRDSESRHLDSMRAYARPGSSTNVYDACLLELPLTLARLCCKETRSINTITSRNDSPLLCATTKGDVNLALGSSQSALQAVIGSPRGDEKLRTEVVKELLRAGADVNRQSIMRASPLHLAANQHLHEIVDLLIQAGASVNLRATGTSKLPLQEALDGPYFSRPEGLRSERLRYVRDDWRMTRTAQLLLEAGAEVKSLHLNQTRHLGLADVLATHGATEICMDRYGRRSFWAPNGFE